MRMIRLLMATVVVVALISLAITRTRVGRTAVRDQLIEAFNNEFKGRLQIGRMTGNLVYDLYASDIQLFDPKGEKVAQIDSMVIIPDWWDLLRNQISIDKITLFKPKVFLKQRQDKTWNLAETFAPKVKRALNPNRKPLDISSADLNIRQGIITLQSDAPPLPAIEKGQVFDFTHSRIEDFNLSASVDWRKSSKLIDLTGLSFRLPAQNFVMRKLEGQVLLDGQQAVINHLYLRTNTSELRLTAAARGKDFAAKPFDVSLLKETPFEVHLQQLIIKAGDWKPLFPKLPLQDFQAVAQVSGQGSAFNVKQLAFKQGQSLLEGQAEVRIGADSLQFKATFPASRFHMPDLMAWLPHTKLQPYQHFQQVELGLKADAIVGLKAPFWQANAELNLKQAGLGLIMGQIKAAQPLDGPLWYDADLKTQNLDVGWALQKSDFKSRLTGQIQVLGSGTDLEGLAAKLNLRLKNARFGRYNADSLRVQGEIASQTFKGKTFLARAGGTVSTDGTIKFGVKRPEVNLEVFAQQFDFGFIDPKLDLKTKLNGRVNLMGAGASERDFAGKMVLALNPSEFTLKGKTTATTDLFTKLEIQERPNRGTTLQLDGDLATLELESEFNLDQIGALGQYWAKAIQRTLDIELSKRFRPDSTAPNLALDLQAIEKERLAVGHKLGKSGLDRLPRKTIAYLKIRRGAFLTHLIPNFPYFDESVELNWSSLVSPNFGAMELKVKGDSLATGGLRMRGFKVQVAAESRFAPNLTNDLKAAVLAEIDTLGISGQGFKKTNLELTYGYGSGQLYLTTDNLAKLGTFKTWANLDLLKDRNRLTFVELALKSKQYEWLIPRDQVIDLYTDAVILKNLVVERKDPNPSAPVHRVRADGLISALPEDVVQVTAENIDLGGIMRQIKFKESLEGTISGTVAVRKLLSSPEVNGNIHLVKGILNGIDFGDLNLIAAFDPKANALNVNLTTQQPRQPSFNVRQNHLEISGQVGLPLGKREDGSPNQGFLDLAVDLKKLDIFFFKTLFPNEIDRPTGWGHGKGSITGDFKKPIFNADLQFVEGNFKVQDFNLDMDISGHLTIDQAGFHLDELTLVDQTGGKAALRGGILFNDYKYFSFDLDASLDRFQIMNVPYSKTLLWYGMIWATGPATLKGPLYKAFLDAPNVSTTRNSQLFIPITGSGLSKDDTFITFTDSTGKPPPEVKRANLLSGRATGERTFLDGLEMRANINAPSGSTIHLVFDPLLDDVIHTVGYGELQMQYIDGGFDMFGDFNVESGDYLFTAFDVFRKPFKLERGGKLTWTGDAVNAKLDLQASYETVAESEGLEGTIADVGSRVPIKVGMNITGDVNSPIVDVRLAINRNTKTGEFANYEALETELNRSDRATAYAFSVMLTNSFVLAAFVNNQNNTNTLEAGTQVVFTSLAQLLSAYLNRLVNQVIPNANINLGIYQGRDVTRLEELGMTAGIALRFFDERVVIRGEGLLPSFSNNTSLENRFSGEVTFEYRLSNNVALEAFYRKNDLLLGANDIIASESVGIGMNYQRNFADWRSIFKRKKQTPAPPPPNE